MNRISQRHDGMPSILSTAKLGARQPVEVDIIPPGTRRSDGPADRQHGRQNLRRPEDCLSVERLSRISREKTAPIAVGSRQSSHSIVCYAARRDSLFRSRCCGGATPRQCLLLRPFPCLRRLSAISNQNLTSYYFPHWTKNEGLQHDNCDHLWLR